MTNKPCKECFLKDCDCECVTCENARERNSKLTRTELTRLSVEAGLRESTAVSEKAKEVMTKLGLL